MTAQQKPIAYVNLTTTAAITADLLHRSVADWMAERRREIPVSRLATEGAVAPGGSILMVGSCPMLIIPIDRTLPAGTVREDSAQSHVFADWPAALERHRAHLIVMPLLGQPTARATALNRPPSRHLAARHTFDVASALSALPGAVGTFWAPSKLLHDSRDFAERRSWCRKASAELLIRLRWFSDATSGTGEIGACTTGLSVFCGREILHPPTNEDPSEIYGRVLAVCSQLIERGAPPVDGECLGGGPSHGVRLVFDQGRRGDPLIRMEIDRLEYA